MIRRETLIEALLQRYIAALFVNDRRGVGTSKAQSGFEIPTYSPATHEGDSRLISTGKEDDEQTAE